MTRKILLLHNTPKARRYFHSLRDNLQTVNIVTGPIGLGAGARLSAERYQQMAAYTMARKHARHRIPAWRMDLLQDAHEKFAHWHYHAARKMIQRHRPDAIGVWGGQSVDTRAALAAASDLQVPHYIFECGLLPNTTTCDPQGVNFANALPRDPGFYAHYSGSLQQARLPQSLLPRASKHRDAATDLPEKFVFVPFQVRLDSQVLLYSRWIRDMRHLFNVCVEAARQAWPDPELHLVFKLHPSCRQRYPDLASAAAQAGNLLFANGNSTEELIRRAQGVITINSTVGIESLLLDKPVLTLGQACYDTPGVTEAAQTVDDIARWLRGLSAGRLPAARHREAFLHYLAHEYCIPDHHKTPGPAHFTAMDQRLSQHPQTPAQYINADHAPALAA